MLNDLFAYVVVFTVLIVGITAYIENTKYKNSSYGKQSTRSFWNILNDKGGHALSRRRHAQMCGTLRMREAGMPGSPWVAQLK